MDKKWVKWITPILAAATAVFEAGHYSNFFSSEVIVLIFAIITAVSAFTASISGKEAAPTPVAQKKP